jgi:hypothetical protein
VPRRDATGRTACEPARRWPRSPDQRIVIRETIDYVIFSIVRRSTLGVARSRVLRRGTQRATCSIS